MKLIKRLSFLTRFNRREKFVYLFVFLSAVIFNFLVLSPVVMTQVGLDKLARFVYLFFKPICHQIDSRSFHIYGVKLAVCSRCSLIYSGVLIGVVILGSVYGENLLRRSNFILMIALFPSLVEFFVEKFLNVEMVVFKVLASLWLGVLAGLVLSAQIVNMFGER